MREIDFLPDWYPRIQRKRRWVIIQALVTVTMIVLISGFALARKLQVSAVVATAAQTEAQISLSRQQLAQLNEKTKYENELRQQEHIVAQIGIGVETTRLLKAVEDAMTPDMALTNLSLEMEEQPRETDRRLKVVVDGVAPTEMEAVTLLGNLAKVKCFENVAIRVNDENARDGHMTRDFEVTFDMNLNSPAPPTEGR